jgi:uncharacterized protein
MNLAFYISALTIGFLGSFHCAGMCGPIALMLPQSAGSSVNLILSRTIYNAGRIFTYVILGTLFGLLGVAMALKGFQRELSVITGSLILLTIILHSINKNWFTIFNTTNAFHGYIRTGLKKLFAKKNRLSLFLIGVLNGLLPCGFVYLAIAGASSAGSVTGSAVYMLLFGLGTFPMMAAIALLANLFGQKFRKIFSRISVPVALALGVFLIYRGTVMSTGECHVHADANHKAGCIVRTAPQITE